MDQIVVDQERFDKVFEEMREERDEQNPHISGHARLIADYNLRQAILEGAKRWEKEKEKLRKNAEKRSNRKGESLIDIFKRHI
jgi:hypothetical protein